MKKKHYVQPETWVVVLNQPALLAGSGEQPKNAERPDYE